MAKSPLGKLKPVAIGMMELPRLGASILEGYRALGDLSGTVSDAMDECGVAAVLNRKSPERRKVSDLADIEAHNVAPPKCWRLRSGSPRPRRGG